MLRGRLEDESDPNKPEARIRTKIIDAIQPFREDEGSRRLTEGTLKESRYFFETRSKERAAAEGIVYPDQLTPAVLTKFHSSWTNAAQTMQRKQARTVDRFSLVLRSHGLDHEEPCHPSNTGQGYAYPHGLFPKRRVQGTGRLRIFRDKVLIDRLGEDIPQAGAHLLQASLEAHRDVLQLFSTRRETHIVDNVAVTIDQNLVAPGLNSIRRTK